MKLWRDDRRPAPDSSWAHATGPSTAIQAIEAALMNGDPVTEIAIGSNDDLLVQYLAEDVPRPLIEAEVVYLFSPDRVGVQRLKRQLQSKGYPAVVGQHPAAA